MAGLLVKMVLINLFGCLSEPFAMLCFIILSQMHSQARGIFFGFFGTV